MTIATVRHTRGVAARCDAGAAGLVTLSAVALMTALVAVTLGGVVDVASTAARARTAADAAALAAAATSPLVAGIGASQRPADAAGEAAAANGARLLGTDLRDWPLRVEVRVSLLPRTPWARRIVGPSEARAVAGVRPTGTVSAADAALPL